MFKMSCNTMLMLNVDIYNDYNMNICCYEYIPVI